MAQKTSEKGLAGATAPVVTDPGRVRNVVLVGHSGSGKTTLVEALLAATGTIPRAGSVTDGTTVSDNDPAAIRQQRSVSLSCAPVVHDDVKINLLDTPGYADFVGELRAGLRAADAALFVVSAVDGVDPATPGSAGSLGGLRPGRRRGGPALFVVAAVAAVPPPTVALGGECASAGLPRAVATPRLDPPRADFGGTLEDCQNAFGENVMPI